MANKNISALDQIQSIQTNDNLVIEQNGEAMRMTGQQLVSWLTSYADGHGGVQYATVEDSGVSGDGQLHTVTLHYADETTSTFSLRDGWKGDTGDSWYVHLKYAADIPTSDADMGDTPDNYIGIYSGTSPTAPTAYTSYTWFQWKGDRGRTGDACTIVTQEIGYMESQSGTVVPEGSWASTIPTVPSGHFLWTRTRISYNSGDVVTSYAVSRNGVDGTGAVSSVNSLSPDAEGNIELTAADISTSGGTSVQARIAALEQASTDAVTYEVRHITGSITSLPKSFSYAFITADHRVINCVFGTPSALTGDVTWTTSAGDVTFTGTLANLGSTTIDFDIVKVITP